MFSVNIRFKNQSTRKTSTVPFFIIPSMLVVVFVSSSHRVSHFVSVYCSLARLSPTQFHYEPAGNLVVIQIQKYRITNTEKLKYKYKNIEIQIQNIEIQIQKYRITNTKKLKYKYKNIEIQIQKYTNIVILQRIAHCTSNLVEIKYKR